MPIVPQKATNSSDSSHTIVTVTNSNDFNPLTWWNDSKTAFPTLYQDALDVLSIPATSAECESLFSSAKKMITPERKRLQDDILEATECLRAWWVQGLTSQS